MGEQLMPFKNKVTAMIDGKKALLLNPLVYEGKHQRIVVPNMFTTDFATVPQVVTWLIPTMGAYTGAAIVHDYLCEQLNGHHRHPELIFAPVSARDTDGIFRRIMREEGVPPVRRRLIWVGVRWGALFNPARRQGWLKDAPLVLLVSLFALPIVLPASVLALVGNAIVWAAETVRSWFG
jgi:hypothetical protein